MERTAQGAPRPYKWEVAPGASSVDGVNGSDLLPSQGSGEK